MSAFSDLIAQGSAHAWLFIPSAILLGALHGLEPGHSKTMMAAFIVAIRGTVRQAFLLGIAAAVSHTAVVWIIAVGGLYLWQGIAAEEFEPWLQLASGIFIVGMALWMIWWTWEGQRKAARATCHSHGPDVRYIDTGHGTIALEIFEQGVPPRWRIRNEHETRWHADELTVTTERPDGLRTVFTFADRGGYLESAEEIREPHAFMARVSLAHGGHSHSYDLSFVEGQNHDRMHGELHGPDIATDGYQDAHALAHANDIRRRFADRNVTTWQIVLFGLTGGLIPCPAAITVLLLCIQLREISLGAVLVLCFSIGLAITLVAVGLIAALSVRHVSARSRWFSTLAARMPYVSGGLLLLVGLYVGYHGVAGLSA
jgi:nickel/cobalt exporter